MVITAPPSSLVLHLLCKELIFPGSELQRTGITLHFGRAAIDIMFVRDTHVIVNRLGSGSLL